MRLGRTKKVCGPGTAFVLPFVEKAIRIDVRIISVEIPSFQIITNDRGLVEISLVVFYKIFDPIAAYCGVQNKDEVAFIFFKFITFILDLTITILQYYTQNFK